MPRRLPSLNALRAFEAAARLGSFTLAARELFVTHAAISRHIRELEDWLAVKLFTRTGRGVKLAEPGRQFSHRLSRSSTNWPMPSGKSWATPISGNLRSPSSLPLPHDGLCLASGVSTLPILTSSSWFSPSSAILDIAASEFDLGIRTGNGQWEGVEATLISDYQVFPICSPKLIEGDTLLLPSSLPTTRFCIPTPANGGRIGSRPPASKASMASRGPMFQDHLAIEAAEAGQGFALGL